MRLAGPKNSAAFRRPGTSSVLILRNNNEKFDFPLSPVYSIATDEKNLDDMRRTRCAAAARGKLAVFSRLGEVA